MDVTLTPLPAAPVDWVPVDSCTLPSVEQPLRVAEFDDLFTATLRAVERSPAATRARLVLAGGPGLAERVQRLADAETACCSFFTFTVTRLDADPGGAAATALALEVEVPAARAEVLTALLARAERARQGTA
jgi:hypothetical protein